MKLLPANSARSQRASALVMALVFGLVVGIVLASYLALLKSRMLIRARSFSWNSAIPVLEAGIEEALTHLHADGAILNVNGWTNSGSGATRVFKRRRDFSDGSYCVVTISNAVNFPFTAPIIYSHGFAPAPLGQGYLSRRVRVDLTNAVIFSSAIAAKGQVDLNGQTTVDSFDSGNTNYSTGGLYDAAKRKDNGRVVTDSNANPAIDAGNGHIYGISDTGPTGTTSTTAGGTIGDLVWSAGNSGIETGYANYDMNVYYPDQIEPPSSPSWPAGPASGPSGAGFNYPLIVGPHYAYEMNNESNKVSGSFSLNGSMIVVGNCSLYVAGDFTINGSGQLTIAPNASLTLYVGGNTSVGGNGIINNAGLASNFAYYGLTNNTNIKITGNFDFIATVNAPEADFVLTGGANFYGAAIVNSYTSKSAGAGFHFDEALSYRGSFTLLSYLEL
jgi:hypothetical protein